MTSDEHRSFPATDLTKEQLFLEEKLLQQQLLEDFLIFCWVEVLNIVADDGLVNWDGGNVGNSDEDEQSLWSRGKRLISTLVERMVGSTIEILIRGCDDVCGY